MGGSEPSIDDQTSTSIESGGLSRCIDGVQDIQQSGG